MRSTSSDDESPYDRIPTTKWARLVFVEHIEMT
jgi:hypothetical protein